VPDVISNYNICIVKNMRLTSNIISRATQMKLIMQFGVGIEGNNLNYDNFDVSSILSA
jgi:phosphoglycerate dehydrogenase-like enzyme